MTHSNNITVAYGPYLATIVQVETPERVHMSVDVGFGIHLYMVCVVPGLLPQQGMNADVWQLQNAQRLLPLLSRVVIRSHSWDKNAGTFRGSIMLGNGSNYATTMNMYTMDKQQVPS